MRYIKSFLRRENGNLQLMHISVPEAGIAATLLVMTVAYFPSRPSSPPSITSAAPRLEYRATLAAIARWVPGRASCRPGVRWRKTPPAATRQVYGFGLVKLFAFLSPLFALVCMLVPRNAIRANDNDSPDLYNIRIGMKIMMIVLIMLSMILMILFKK